MPPNASPADTPTLEARGVRVAFSGVLALDDVSASVGGGEILGMIGPNGAGKTTLINVISGFVTPTTGEVALGDRRVTRLSPERRAALGLARTFQGVRLFGRLTVAENVAAAALAVGGGARGGDGGDARGGARLRGGARRAAARVREVLARLELEHRADLPAGELSYGEERRVGIARALATDPAFLLLDEPAAGLDDAETAELASTLATIRADLGTGMLVIEHDMSLIMGLCDRVQVLAEGRTIAVGTPAEVRQHPEVRRAYLGEEREQPDARQPLGEEAPDAGAGR
jgi:branched-chain amino acid transport system ATP-binding protein